MGRQNSRSVRGRAAIPRGGVYVGDCMIDMIVKVLLIMTVLFAFAVPGFLLRKKNMVSGDSPFTLSNILLYVCQPLLIVKTFAVNPIAPEGDTLLRFLYVLGFSFLGLLLTFGVAAIWFRRVKMERKKQDILIFISVFSNCGFVGIPFVDMLTGGDSRATMYIIIFNAAFNILLWTLGAYLITQDKTQISVKKAFLNPCTIATVVGFLLFLFPQINIFDMPKVEELQQIVVFTGNMTAPLSMLIVGIRLAELSPKQLFCDKGIYLASVMRLLVAPLVTYLIVLPFRLWGIFENDPYLLLAPVIAMAMPPAASIVAFCEKHDGEKMYAAANYATGTILALISLPLVLFLITW